MRARVSTYKNHAHAQRIPKDRHGIKKKHQFSLDLLLDAIGKSVYQAAYACYMFLPGKNRGKSKRARQFAQKIREQARVYTPVVLAIVLNALLLLTFGAVRYGRESYGDGEAITATIDKNWFVETLSAAPEGAKSGGAENVLKQGTEQMVMKQSSSTTSAGQVSVSTQSQGALQFDVGVVPQQPIVVGEKIEEITANLEEKKENTGHSKAAGNGGSGKSKGNLGYGEGDTGMGTSANASGKRYASMATPRGNVGEGWKRPGKDALKNQKIVVIYDVSQVGPGDHTVLDMKPNIKALLGILKRDNEQLEFLKVASGIMATEGPVAGGNPLFPLTYNSKTPDSSDATSEKNGVAGSHYSSERHVKLIDETMDQPMLYTAGAWYAVWDAAERHKGENAIIVVISDFIENYSRNEDIPTMVEHLIKNGCRLYLISTMEQPGQASQYMALQSGGGVRRYNFINNQDERVTELSWRNLRGKSTIEVDQ